VYEKFIPDMFKNNIIEKENTPMFKNKIKIPNPDFSHNTSG